MDREKELSEMLRLAEQNLELANHENLFFFPKPFEMICYNCQQSAEKYLKAFLIKNKIQYRRTHDLRFLNECCEEISDDFEQLYEDCERLNEYGVMPKYPHELQLDDLVIKNAIQSARNIEKFILEKLGKEKFSIQEPVVDEEVKQVIFEMLDAKLPLDSIRKISRLSIPAFSVILNEYDELAEESDKAKNLEADE